MMRGSIAHTSPRLPEKMHRDSLELSPIVRLIESSNTDPPLSLIKARPGQSVHCERWLLKLLVKLSLFYVEKAWFFGIPLHKK